MNSEDIKAILGFIICIEIIFCHEIMHIQKIAVTHTFNKFRCHSFWRILDIFLSQFRYLIIVSQGVPPVVDIR